jgi:hypothetical protein
MNTGGRVIGNADTAESPLARRYLAPQRYKITEKTINSAGNGSIFVQNSGIRAYPLKYTDPTATAQAGLQFNSNGIALNLEAKAATVSGRATLEFDVFGVRVELGVTGNALSVGAGVSLGVTGNKGFYAKASAALGVGGEVLLRIQKKP